MQNKLKEQASSLPATKQGKQVKFADIQNPENSEIPELQLPQGKELFEESHRDAKPQLPKEPLPHWDVSPLRGGAIPKPPLRKPD